MSFLSFLSMAEALALAENLYADEDVKPEKALIAHVMRVWHETAEELGRLVPATHRVARARAGGSDNARKPGVARMFLPEPFDGTVRWDLLTPLPARHEQEKHARGCPLAVGENARPKPAPNLLRVTRVLGLMGGYRANEFGRVQEHWDVHGG